MYGRGIKLFSKQALLFLSYFLMGCNDTTVINHYYQDQNVSPLENITIVNNYYQNGNASNPDGTLENTNQTNSINDSNTTSATTIAETNSTENSLKGIALYKATLRQINGTRDYHIEAYDGVTADMTPLYFDLETKSFELRDEEQEIFINGQQNSFANLDYEVNASGKLISSSNSQKIYTLSLVGTESIQASYFDEYRSNIEIQGEAYEIEKEYLANFYIVEKLLSSTVFDSINGFVQHYRTRAFRGTYFRGLVFGEENKLREKKDGNYTDAGTYEIKTVDDMKVLLIYPTDSEYYYADNSCYILNFSRIWQSKCHFKGTKETKNYYDKDVYDDLLLYLKAKFIEYTVSI